MKNAHIISIGNELLVGDTVNTNASWIGNSLTEQGFLVEQVITIPDEYRLIRQKIEHSMGETDLTIVTGGLGPTHDDITKKVIADLYNSKLIENKEVLDHIKSIFNRRGFRLNDSSAEQALVPENCTVLFNNSGTTPGLWLEEEECVLVVLPGVPLEMRYLMEKRVLPKIDKHFPGREVWASQYFKTAGIPESTLSDRVGNLDEFVNNGVGVSYLPEVSGVTIRISAKGLDKDQADDKLKKLRKLLLDKAGEVIYGEGKNLTLEEAVGRILTEKGLTIATAESCTGGLLASNITDIPGSSGYMKGGVVVYANEMKQKLLDVSADDLQVHGAVSRRVALQMAKGVADRFDADIGVSTTGVAGPGGGTPEKPVGTVWTGFWLNGKHFALKATLTNDRYLNKQRSVMIILETVRRQLLNVHEFPYHLKPHSA